MKRLIAHRGLKDNAQENTMQSFLNALKNDQYAGFECDIRTSKDKIFVICHNPMVGLDLVSNTNYKDLEKKYHLVSLEKVLKLSSDKIFLLEIKESTIDIKKFQNLESIYKSVLYEMYKTPTHSIKMELSNAVATYLVNIHAINSGRVSTIGYTFEFYLQPWVVWGIEAEIKISEKVIKKFEKAKQKLQKRRDFIQIQEIYEQHKEFLKFIFTESDNNSQDEQW